jgi:hypothetical protein
MACSAIRDAVQSMNPIETAMNLIQLGATNGPEEGKHPAECSDPNSNKARDRK